MGKIQFQHLSIVRLLTKELPPPETPDDRQIQLAHLRYLRDLKAQGVVLLNGPVVGVDDQRVRGMTIYSVDVDAARRLANDDPAVKAGWFEAEVNGWRLPAIPTMLGDRVDSDIEIEIDL